MTLGLGQRQKPSFAHGVTQHLVRHAQQPGPAGRAISDLSSKFFSLLFPFLILSQGDSLLRPSSKNLTEYSMLDKMTNLFTASFLSNSPPKILVFVRSCSYTE